MLRIFVKTPVADSVHEITVKNLDYAMQVGVKAFDIIMSTLPNPTYAHGVSSVMEYFVNYDFYDGPIPRNQYHHALIYLYSSNIEPIKKGIAIDIMSLAPFGVELDNSRAYRFNVSAGLVMFGLSIDMECDHTLLGSQYFDLSGEPLGSELVERLIDELVDTSYSKIEHSNFSLAVLYLQSKHDEFLGENSMSAMLDAIRNGAEVEVSLDELLNEFINQELRAQLYAKEQEDKSETK